MGYNTRATQMNASGFGDLGDRLIDQELLTGWHQRHDRGNMAFYAQLEPSGLPLPSGTHPPYLADSPSDIDTVYNYLNEVKRVLNLHLADGGTSADVHKAADAVNVITSPDATTVASAVTLANEIRTDYNAHVASATFHNVADIVNSITVAASSDTGEPVPPTLSLLTYSIVWNLRQHVFTGALRMDEEVPV